MEAKAWPAASPGRAAPRGSSTRPTVATSRSHCESFGVGQAGARPCSAAWASGAEHGLPVAGIGALARQQHSCPRHTPRLVRHDVLEVGVGLEAVALEMLVASIERERHVGGDGVGGIVILERLGSQRAPIRVYHHHIVMCFHRTVLPAIGAPLGGQRGSLDALGDHRRSPSDDADR